MAKSVKEYNPGKLDLGVIGTSGLQESGGVIDEEWHPKLRSDFGPKVYREMADNSSTIGAIRYVIRALVRQVEWRVEPASPEEPALDAAEFLESCLLDTTHTFEDFVSEVLSFLDYGWSLFETVYKVRKGDTQDKTTSSQFTDGKIGWRKLALRSQDTRDRWEFEDETRELTGMFQNDPSATSEVFIPIEKAILFRTETYKENPEGRSIYRNAVIDYFYLKRICEIEAIGIERDMTGLITMEVPLQLLSSDAPPAAKALRTQFETMLAQIKRDEREYAIVPAEMDPEGKPTGYKLKLLSSGGRRQIDTNGVKDYYKTSILQSVLAQFLQLGMTATGSFALSSNQTDMFAIALGAYLDVITSTFNRQAVSRLMRLNGVAVEYWPELVHGDLESPNLAELGTYVQSLATSGQLPPEDEAIQRKLLEVANLPMPEREEGDEYEKVEKTNGGLKPKFHECGSHGRVKAG
jgi:hypothetical protein